MFAPKWKKEALNLAKGARKFVNYKRDLLKPERIAEIESRRADLLAAIKTKDTVKITEASRFLQAECEKSLPREKPSGWFEENVEVLFVAIVIALGLRTYYLQPFRIPTGSMQPTLNGIIGNALPDDKWPSFPQRLAEKVLRGRKYVKLVTTSDKQIAIIERSNGFRDFDITNHMGISFLGKHLPLPYFSYGVIRCTDGSVIKLPAPIGPCREAGLTNALQIAAKNYGLLPKGTILCEGTIDTGDLVLVDKVSYHFRKPKRGEVFVFDTIGIKGIHDRGGEQASGSHYIKRLCGLPGDTLSIDTPNLLIDGKIAHEPGISRVAAGENGYILADQREPTQHLLFLAKPTDTLHLADKSARPGLREYAALGDNTGNSLDSRYWGSVKEHNLVGPALFSLWPFTTNHWGFIR